MNLVERVDALRTASEPLPSSRGTARLRRIGAFAILILLTTGTAWSRAPQAPLEPDAVGGSEMLWEGPNGMVPLPIVNIAVDLEVTGVVLRGRVTQTFRNPMRETIDAVYAFPLPERAAVRHMELRIGGRRIVSEVQEKRQARETYEAAREEGRKAALVQQDFGNLFTTRAANIDPGETIEVILEYLEEVDWTEGAFSLRFPLTYVPRFEPPPDDSSGAPDLAAATGHRNRSGALRTKVPDATVRVTLDAGFELAEVASSSHDLRAGPQRAPTRIDTGLVEADRDFLLRWTPVPGEQPRSAVLIEERDDGRYGLAMVLPPAGEGDVARGLATETLFVVDVSGSMDGPPLRQAREALLAALDRLRPEDRFNIIRFSGGHSAFADRFVHAEGADLQDARRWVGALEAEGGTMILPALVTGMEMLGRSRSTAAQRVVFLTDGAVSNEPQLLDAVVEGLGDARLHTIGIGHAPNTWLMRKMALHGRGLCAFISDVHGARNDIDTFFARLERPVLSDVTLDWEGARPLDLSPARLTDLYAGEPLVLSFRLPDDATPSHLTLGGYSRIGKFEQRVALTPKVSRRSGLAVRWARSRVDAWMDSLHEGADARYVRDRVVEVALRFGLVTRYTSLVAVDHGQDELDLDEGARIAARLPQGGSDAGLRFWLGWILMAAGCAALGRHGIARLS